MELTPRLLTEVEFREQWRGYSQNEVDDFLERVAAAVAELRLIDLAEDDEIRRTLVLAQRTASTALEEAQAEAARILSDAEERKAEMEAEISDRTERELGDILARRRALESDIATLTAFVEEQRANVRMELQRQLDALDALPDLTPPRVTEFHEPTPPPSPPTGSSWTAPAAPPPRRDAPLSAPRAPTDEEVAQAREDLVEALRRAGVDDLFQEAAAPEAQPPFESEKSVGPYDVSDESGEIPIPESTSVYDALADDDDEDEDDASLSWAAQTTPEEDDPFLAELRRAVTDTEPLGPRDHDQSASSFDETEDDMPGGRFRLRRGR